jgi:integrase
MDYEEFKERIRPMDQVERAFLSILFFTGCRISEALALTSDNITISKDVVYIDFHRLKGSKQTDPQQIPVFSDLGYVLSGKGQLFDFSRTTGYKIIKQAFPELYPHYFRMNRITKTLERFGVAVVQNIFGLSLNAIEHYIGKVDIKKVGKALKEEIH